MSRVIAVSNRVQLPREGQASGGLAVGVLAALEEHGGLWFGWSGKVTGGVRTQPEVVHRDQISYVTVDLTQDEVDLYYNGFCNGALWPLVHYVLSRLKYDRRHWEAYLRVNAFLADVLLPWIQEGDVVWIHDFHLIPLASELRRRGVDQPMGFFLHTPFPDYDVVRALPVHRELLRAMCAYDVVGFQTESDLSSFNQCLAESRVGRVETADRRTGGRGRVPETGAFPIGIDVDACVRAAEEGTHGKGARELTADGSRSLILGVDRLDYSKGLSLRFKAFERFLDRYPEQRGGVVYMQVAPPTRQGVRAYEEIREELEQSAGNINGRHSDVGWVPIHYLHQAVPREELMGIMRAANVGFVTPIRDGMNLVAKEYVAAQDPADPGVLVLSEMAGAAAQLDAAVLVNPYDVDGVAEGLLRALRMPLQERQNRHRAMMETLRRDDISAWRTRFLDALSGAAGPPSRIAARPA